MVHWLSSISPGYKSFSYHTWSAVLNWLISVIYQKALVNLVKMMNGRAVISVDAIILFAITVLFFLILSLHGSPWITYEPPSIII